MKRRSKFRTAFALAAGVALALVTVASPASAAGSLATGTIGTRTSVTLSNTWSSISPNLPADSSIVVTANFSSHTATSVKITSFTICYSGPAGSAVQLTPYTRNAGGNYWYGNAVIAYKNAGQAGTCHTWSPNKIYYKQADGEVVRIVTQIGDSYALIAAFKR